MNSRSFLTAAIAFVWLINGLFCKVFDLVPRHRLIVTRILGETHAAFVDTSHLRPRGFPEFLGNDFFLAGYRIFVNYRNNQGKKLRGLYILRSETNKTKMSFLGNIFTHYNYLKTDIQYHRDKEKISIFSNNSSLDIQASLNGTIPGSNHKK